jgi:hypothetical protein
LVVSFIIFGSFFIAASGSEPVCHPQSMLTSAPSSNKAAGKAHNRRYRRLVAGGSDA